MKEFALLFWIKEKMEGMEEIGIEKPSVKGLDAFPNSGSVAPRPGDILCCTSGPGGYGQNILSWVKKNL